MQCLERLLNLQLLALDAILAIGCLANSGANHAQKYKVLLPIRAHFNVSRLNLAFTFCINPGCESSKFKVWANVC